jgi:hypothetical protein
MLYCMFDGQSLLAAQWIVLAAATTEPENAQARPTAAIIDMIVFIGVLPFGDLPPKNIRTFFSFVGAGRAL